jgi:hypothetical protein
MSYIANIITALALLLAASTALLPRKEQFAIKKFIC